MKVEIAFEIPDAVVDAAPTVALIILLAVWLAIRVRRRRKRERAERLMFVFRRDTVPSGACAVIEEIRRDADAAHQRYLRREMEEDWKRDGCVELMPKGAS